MDILLGKGFMSKSQVWRLSPLLYRNSEESIIPQIPWHASNLQEMMRCTCLKMEAPFRQKVTNKIPIQQLLPFAIRRVSNGMSKLNATFLRANQTKFQRSHGARTSLSLTNIPHIATSVLTLLHRSKACGTDILAQLRQCIIALNFERQITKQFF